MASYPTHVRLLPSTETLMSKSSENASSICRAAVLTFALHDAPSSAVPPLSEVDKAFTTTVSLDTASLGLLRVLKSRTRCRSLTSIMATVTFDPGYREMLEAVLRMSPYDRTALLAETLAAYSLPPDLLPSRRPPAPLTARVQQLLRTTELAVVRLLTKHADDLSPFARKALDQEVAEIRRKLAGLPASS